MSFTLTQIEKLNNARLSDKNLKPVLVSKVRQIIDLARADGLILLVTQAFRSIAEQNKLYAQGRTRPGKIVTNAKGGQSKHNFGEAVDFGVMVKISEENYELTWNEKPYFKIGDYAKKVGLVWGGSWKSIKDKPHVEL